ncbi:B3/B4 domain-containing protein [Streptomyces orinoci]|uniref:Phenylalanine--tRNA ligase beta subunit-related protein n=1 Tax=Streptomyces orinoci TaxID=67339 RepID=A0ABV3JQQ9_STRON|nr:phenylalanine--tRNA ligase beta subunit-related protein [Streptomyces orinoci]
MDSLTVTIDERIVTRVPGYVLGLIALPEIEVTRFSGAVDALLTEAEGALHRESPGRAEIAALPAVAAWREAYRAFGVNPSRFPCAVESLLRRVAKGDRLPRINSMVDLCNAVSLATRLPIASCDIGTVTGRDREPGRLTVRPSDGSEVYLPLGAPGAPEHPDPGEVVYADGQGRAHSRRWNWRQSDLIKTVPGRRRLLITVEAVHQDGTAAVDAALARLTAALKEHTGEVLGPVVLDRAARSGRPFAASALSR